jgi:hypothetical protein
MSEYTPEFEAILDECLRDVLRGARTIEQCLERYPEYAADLKPALQIGLLTSRLKSPEMPSISVDRLENRLRERMTSNAKPKIVRLRFAPFAKLAAMIAIVFFVALGSGAGAVAASSNAVPGDWLYGLKRLWEAIVLALTPLTGQVDDLWLHMADRRLDEVEELSQRGQLTDSALLELYMAMAQAITLADAETEPELMVYLSEAQATLVRIQPPLQDEALYRDIMRLTAPTIRDDGSLEAPSVSPPSLSFTPTSTLTATAARTATATPTERREMLPTLPVTAMETVTATHTSTPRVPPTATRTPTPTSSPTASITPSPTPTATWTPLPLPTLPGSTPIVWPTARSSSGGQEQPTNTPDIQATVRLRETEMSVYLTQTAGPMPTEASAP